MSSATLTENEFTICPPPDKSEIEGSNNSQNSYVNQDLTALVVEFEQPKGSLDYRLSNVLVRLAGGQIQTIDLQWCKSLSCYLMLASQDWAEQGESLQFWNVADATYWASPTQGVYELGNCVQLAELPAELDIAQVLSEAIELEEPPLYCSSCHDYFPSGQTCQHIYFCEGCKRVVTPSSSCDHQKEQEAEPKQAA